MGMEQVPAAAPSKPKRAWLYITLIFVIVAAAAFAGWRVIVARQEAAQFKHDFGPCGVIAVADAVKDLTDAAGPTLVTALTTTQDWQTPGAMQE